MNKHSDTCGLFGKIPQQADFVSHFLTNEYTEYWHSWLQSSLSVSQEQLGENWLNIYLTSPIWRFAIMPNIITPQAIIGVLVPSVDEVGRYYPVTIAHQGEHSLWSAYLNGDNWYQQVQNVALYALDETTTYATLMAQLESLACPQFPKIETYSSQSLIENRVTTKHVFSMPVEKNNNDFMISLLNNAYLQKLGNYSLWWTEGSEHIDPCLLISDNLPDAGQFAAMLDGNWLHWGWSQELVNSMNSNNN